MAKYLSKRQKDLSIGIGTYTENDTVLDVTGKVGIGTTNATRDLDVVSEVRIRERIYDNTDSAGTANFVLASGGPAGNWTWKPVTDVGAGILDAIFVRDNGSDVGAAGTNTTLDFYENFSLTQPVAGIAYIGIIAADTLIGLSKYTRIAQWCAQRGTLQEELAMDIAREIMDATGSTDVGVYIQATHGCCENRGIRAHSSLTQTTVLKGAFKEDGGVKKEFMDNIKLQQEFAPR